jgi:hypothetical protein
MICAISLALTGDFKVSFTNQLSPIAGAGSQNAEQLHPLSNLGKHNLEVTFGSLVKSIHE